MRPLLLLLLLLVAACASPKPSNAPAARWEIDKESNLALPVCSGCENVVLRNESKCAGCGAAYRIEPKRIDCPECRGARQAEPRCEACEDAGKCAICEGTGVFDGGPCPECEGARACAECRGSRERACDNCGGKGTIELK